MKMNKLEYESPRYELVADELEDIVTASDPDFDGGQSGLSF